MKTQMTAWFLMLVAFSLGAFLTASLSGCQARTKRTASTSGTTAAGPVMDDEDERVPSEPFEPTMSSKPETLTEEPATPSEKPVEPSEDRVPSEPTEPTATSTPASLPDEPKPTPSEEPKPEPKPEPADEPKPEPADAPKPEPTDNKPAVKVEPPVPNATPPAPDPAPAEEPKDEPKPEPKPEPAPEPKPEPQPEPKDEPKDEPKPEPDPQPTAEPKEGDTARAEVKTEAKGALASVDKKANPQLKEGDWPQWGGSSFRNNTPVTGPLPESFDIGGFDRKTGEWKKDQAENIQWVASLGSQTYGNPVVAGGKVYVGTNNGNGYLPRYPSDVDLGCLLCFNEADGTFLWQHSSEKLDTGRVHDWPLQGVCCAPYVEGERLWFVTNRGEVRCLDTQGFYDDEDDGPVQNERGRLFNLEAANEAYGPTVAALDEGKISDALRAEFERVEMKLPEDVKVESAEAGKKWTATAEVNGSSRQFQLMVAGPRLAVFKTITPDDKHEADTIWVVNMMTELGVSQHNMCSCSVTAVGDILFVNTSNGLDESHINLPAPDAPSFMAMDKNTGEIFWTDKSPTTNILHGQWSSPAVAELGGVPQAIFPGGDGWIYSFKADKGKDGQPELLWKFDANPKETKWILGGRGTRNNIIATPVVYDGLVYVAVGQDPEHGEGDGHLWCIDPNKRGDVSPQLAMKIEGDKRVPIPHRRLQAIVPEDGEVAVDNPNSAVVWHYSAVDQDGNDEIDFEEQLHRSIGTVAIKDDLLYLADFSGLFHCLDAKGDGNGNPKVYWTYDMLAASWGSPLIADGKVYIGDEDGDVSIFPLTKENQEEPMEEINMGSSVYSTPVAANGSLFISTKDKLFRITEGAQGAE